MFREIGEKMRLAADEVERRKLREGKSRQKGTGFVPLATVHVKPDDEYGDISMTMLHLSHFLWP